MFTRGILWMHKRNNNYIKRLNPEQWIKLANNKYKTKQMLAKRSISVPETFKLVKNFLQRLSLDIDRLQSHQFVIKPNQGSKGNGIFLVKGVRKIDTSISKKRFEKLHDIITYWTVIKPRPYEYLVWSNWISDDMLTKKVFPIFSWRYSLNYQSDSVLIEELLVAGSGFEDFCRYGLADIRVIVCNLVPISAMLRMPTEQSWWKANLAQGGIGFGIDIASGTIVSCSYKDIYYATTFPDVFASFKWKKLMFWDQILYQSASIQFFTNVGYLGLDRVITSDGPKLLEANARAWLEIQNITGKPLLHRIRKIEDITIKSPEKWVEIAKTLFSSKDRTTNISFVYLSQWGRLTYIKDTKRRGLAVIVKLDIHKEKNYCSAKVWKKIMSWNDLQLKLLWSDISFHDISFIIDTTLQWNTVTLGYTSVKSHPIKAIHTYNIVTSLFASWSIDEDEVASLKFLDDTIKTFNQQLNLSQLLYPINYLQEFDRFVSRWGAYNPVFRYQLPSFTQLQSLTDEIDMLMHRYRHKQYFNSSISTLFFHKLDETLLKIKLIRAYKRQDFDMIHQLNSKIFAKIDPTLLQLSKQKITQWLHFKPSELWDILAIDEVLKVTKEYIRKQKISNIRIKQVYDWLSRMSLWIGKYATLQVSSWIEIRFHKLIAKLIHEIDVHARRFLQGKKSWRNILATGTAWYLKIEEGIAILKSDMYLQSIIADYDSISKYKNYDRVATSATLNFLQMYEYIMDTKSQLSRRDDPEYSYKSLFNTLLQYYKWMRNTDISDTGVIFGKNLLYLEGYMLARSIDQHDPKTIEKLLASWKISVDDLEYFV